MAGYQEIISDPSYTDQAIVMSYPLIGNYGITDEDFESKLLNLGAEAAEMTGSGPAVFAVFEYEKAARNALSELLKNTELSFTGIYRTVNNN